VIKVKPRKRVDAIKENDMLPESMGTGQDTNMPSKDDLGTKETMR